MELMVHVRRPPWLGKEDGSVGMWGKYQVGSVRLLFLSGVPPLQEEETVKWSGASLDSASSGCHHLDMTKSRHATRW